MNDLLKNILKIVGIIILISALQIIFKFLGISFAEYGTYLIWSIALVIFYYILPDMYPIMWFSN